MKNFLKFIILLAVPLNIAYGKIIETNSLVPFEKEAEKADKQTLVIFDVQEVLLVAKDKILSPPYKDDNKIFRDKIIATHTHEEQEKLFSIILKEYETEIVDPKLIKTLEDLKRKEIRAIALTSGYTGKYGVIDNRENLRLQRLRKVGFNFNDSFPNVGHIIFLKLKGASHKHIPMFKDGVIFTCRLDKGEVLKAFLNRVNFKPKKIIFVDNKLKNIKSVEAYCEEEGISFIGFHYNFVKSKPKIVLNKAVADYQYKTLEHEHKWSSDQEAIRQLKKK